MSNAELNKSRHFIGESISGHFIISVDEEDPAIPSIDILEAGLEFIIKDDVFKPDSEALVILTVGDGLEVIENTQVIYNVIYRIPGIVTANFVPKSARETSVILYYEINCTFVGETESNVLETGTIVIQTNRVKTF